MYNHIWLYKRLYTKTTEIVIIMVYIRAIVTGCTPWPSILTKNSPILIYILTGSRNFRKQNPALDRTAPGTVEGTSPKEFQKAA